MQEISLSVIVPVYKVEPYLERGVYSILNQAYKSMELILVDDGSPDNCPLMCDQFAERYANVKVIHKLNGGLSSARNAGIMKAIGKYIIFMDSDDQWQENKLEELMSSVLTHDKDLTFFGSLGVKQDGTVLKKKDDRFYGSGYRIVSIDELYPLLISEGDLHEGASALVIKRDFIIRNNLFFYDQLIGEDTEWMFRALRCVSEVAISNVRLYLYSIARPGSITQTVSYKSVSDTLKTIQSSLDFYSKNPNLKVKDWELTHCSYLWAIAMGNYYKVSTTEKKDLKKQLMYLRSQLDLSAHPKSQKVGLVYDLFGFSITSFALNLYMVLHEKNFINKKDIIKK